MADALNRIAPATVPLGRTVRLKREREEKQPGAGKRDKPSRPVGETAPPDAEIDKVSESEKNKGKHLNISV